MRYVAVVVLLGTMLALHARATGLYATPEDETIERQILKFSGEKVPLILTVGRDAFAELDRLPCTAEELRQRLVAIARVNHDIPILIVAGADIPRSTVRAMEKICRDAGLNHTMHIHRMPRPGPDESIIKT